MWRWQAEQEREDREQLQAALSRAKSPKARALLQAGIQSLGSSD